MRRFLCNKFIAVTKFKKTEKQQKVRRSNLIRCANNMVDELNLPHDLNNFPFYYMALAYPSELKKVLNDAKNTQKQNAGVINQAMVIVKLIENVLNRFSKRIFGSFMEIPEIAVLVQHFLSQNTENLDQIEGFGNWVAILQERSQEVIDSFEDNPKAFANNPYWLKNPLFVFNQD